MTRLLILFTLLVSAQIVGAQQKDGIDRFIDSVMKRDSVPGATLLITRGNKVVKHQSYGYANLEWKVPAKNETVYELASVSKPITATAILMLMEQGRLSLDSSIAAYLGNDVPESYRGVTLRRLLSHTSGIPSDHYVYTKLYGPSMLRYNAKEQLTDLFKLKPLVPGEKFVYSNAGFFLLGLIIERVSGQTYQDFIRQYIFEPSGMKTAGFINGDSIVPLHAQGYTKRKGKLVRFSLEAVIQSLDANGFGGLMATAADADRFVAALLGGQLIKKETLREIAAPVLLNNGEVAGPRGDSKVGLGWFLKTINGKRCFNHSGHTGTVVLFVPDENLRVVLFSNLSSGYTMLGDKGFRVADVGTRIVEMAMKTN